MSALGEQAGEPADFIGQLPQGGAAVGAISALSDLGASDTAGDTPQPAHSPAALNAVTGPSGSQHSTAAPVDTAPLLAAERSQLLADRVGVGFWQRDMLTGALHWDAQMFRIHRRDPALGAPHHSRWIEACVHPLDRAWVTERLRQIEAEWAPATDLRFRALQPDDQGGERWVQIWGRRLRRGDQRLCFGMHLDVTDHQRQQSLLAHERERTRFAIAAAEVGVWECDPDGRLCHANEVMYRQLGLDVQARVTADASQLPRLLSRQVRRLAHPDDWQLLQDRLRRRLASGEPFRHELPLRRSGSRPRWLALQGRALRGPDGRVCGMAGVQIDITERKHTEALQLEKQRLEQASRDKSVFMARMSHELRTPMNAVLGFTRLLEDDPLEPPSPRQRERLARIAQAGDRLLALIDNLLDLARLDSGPAAVPPRPLALAELLREAAAAVAGEAERAGVRLQLPHGPGGQALGDRRRLVQALGHVLLQVVQGNAPGAVLVLEAGWEAGPEGDPEGGLEDSPDAARAGLPGFATATAEAAVQPDGVAVVRIFDPALPVRGQPSLFEASEAGHAGDPAAAGGTAPNAASRLDTAFGPLPDTVFDHGLDTEPGAMAGADRPDVDLRLSLALRLVQAVGGHIQTCALPPQASTASSTPAMPWPSAAAAAAAAAAEPVTPGTPRRVHVLRLPGLAPPAPGAAAGRPWPAPVPGTPVASVAPAAPVVAAPGAAPGAGPLQRAALHVLCVEDNPVNLQLLREVFALRPRVRLSTAMDGRSGLAQALAEPPDLVLLDLQLPDMSGLEVLRQLRAQACLARCTMIALSADAMPEHIAAGRAAGFDDYWTKPIQFDRFLADIDRLAEARARR